uniref:Uncharacterized protein n=1 Tax=Anguilla anguilla TaxID=7936 RepID=A0A0E9TR58_ANGAN
MKGREESRKERTRRQKR